MKSDHTSESLTEPELLKLTVADIDAYCCGVPFNWWICIHLKKARISSEGEMSVIIRLKHLLSDWLRNHFYIPLSASWLRENAGQHGSGPHVHIALHIPARMTAKEMKSILKLLVEKWVRLCGGTISSRVVDVGLLFRAHKIGTSDECDSMYIRDGLLGSVVYFGKGAEESVCLQFGIDHKPQGIIVGQRCGVSEFHQPAQRKRRVCNWRYERRLALVEGVIELARKDLEAHPESIVARSAAHRCQLLAMGCQLLRSEASARSLPHNRTARVARADCGRGS
jgi:hypothetical protein